MSLLDKLMSCDFLYNKIRCRPWSVAFRTETFISIRHTVVEIFVVKVAQDQHLWQQLFKNSVCLFVLLRPVAIMVANYVRKNHKSKVF